MRTVITETTVDFVSNDNSTTYARLTKQDDGQYKGLAKDGKTFEIKPLETWRVEIAESFLKREKKLLEIAETTLASAIEFADKN